MEWNAAAVFIWTKRLLSMKAMLLPSEWKVYSWKESVGFVETGFVKTDDILAIKVVPLTALVAKGLVKVTTYVELMIYAVQLVVIYDVLFILMEQWLGVDATSISRSKGIVM